MLLRYLHLFLCAVAVILVASPARAVPEKVPYIGDAKPGTIIVQKNAASISSPGRSRRSSTRSASAAPASNGSAPRGSPANTSNRGGSRRCRCAESVRRISILRADRRKIRWALRRWCWSTTSLPSMAPTIPAQSAALYPPAASACITRTSWICMAVLTSVHG